MNIRKTTAIRSLFLILAAMMAVSVLAACGAGRQSLVAHPTFSAQYIRTDGYHSEITYPVISVIRTKDALSAYYEKNKVLYALERRTGSIPSDSTIGFLDAVDSYDEAFFDKNLLVLVLLQESSGSNRHLVKDIIQGEQSTQIMIERNVPPIGTADMAQWHVIIELKQDEFRDQPTTVQFSMVK